MSSKYLIIGLLIALGFSLNAQVYTVTGSVFDSSDELIGVNIIQKGTSMGTISDWDGTFEVKVDGAEGESTLVFSYTGYEDYELPVNSDMSGVKVELQQNTNMLAEIVVKGQKVSEKTQAAALTVETLDALAIKQTASADFYDGLGAMKGVDLTSASLGIKVVNTRGFNSTAPVRILQVIDGVDNASPSISFALGNFLGASELDLKGVELVVGASSAFFGPNAFNGVIKMTSKDPFYTEGLSVNIRAAERDILETDLRWADSFKNKDGFKSFAYKANFSYLTASDWIADNYASVDSSEVAAKENHYAGYDAVNIYGDEYQYPYDVRGGSPWLNPGLTVFYRNGYKESDLLDYTTKNLKASFEFNLRTNPEKEENSPELSWGANYAKGSTIFQGATRFRLQDVQFYSTRLEFAKRDKYFIRAYMTKDNAGSSYNPFVTAIKLQELQAQDNQAWSDLYYDKWQTNFASQAREFGYPQLEFVDGQPFYDFEAQEAFYDNPEVQDSLRSWHQQTVELVNNSEGFSHNQFLEPGTPEFEEAFNAINTRLSNSQDFETGGSRISTNSELYHINGEYIFTPDWMNKITVGASGRLYRPDTKGTIFNDLDTLIKTYEFGFYGGLEKKLWEDKLTLSATFRADKNKNYDWISSPAASAVFKPTEKDYLRISFSSAIRNPTLGDQFDNIDVGTAVLLGNLGGYQQLTTLDDLNKWRITKNAADLNFFDVAPIQPEKVKTLEAGYRSVFWDKLYLDASYYFNFYDQFIGYKIGLDVGFSQVNTLSFVDAYRVTANADDRVTTHGAAFGLNYYFGDYYQISGNYTWSKLITKTDDEIIPAFNTPEHKFNFSLSGRDVPLRFGGFNAPNFGFNINYKWVEGFIFEGSPQFTGLVPAYDLLDVQVNYRFPNINTTLKIGASNILNNLHFETVGGPLIGRLGYVRLSYQFDNKK